MRPYFIFLVALSFLFSPPAFSVEPFSLTFGDQYGWGPSFEDQQNIGGTIQYVKTPRLRAPYAYAQEGYKDFNFTVDYGTKFDINLQRDQELNGILGVKIYSDENTGVKDKIELGVVSHADPQNGIDFTAQTAIGMRRYLAFDIKFAANYPISVTWSLIMQAFQPCDSGSPSSGPPLCIFVEPASAGNSMGPVNLIFTARDDISHLPGTPPEEGQTYYGESYVAYRWNNVARDTWHRVIIQLQPKHNLDSDLTARGQVGIWINPTGPTAPVTRTWVHDWGYAPCSGTPPRSRLSLGLGIYRSRRPVAQQIYFRNIRYGQGFSQVID